MTSYGKQFIEELMEELNAYQPTIVSGLAYGIDVHAHKQSLKNMMPTFGVVAHGLDKIYPSVHKNVARDMIKNQGAVISEYMSNTIPNRENFPMRNRLVAGMVDAVIVVESANKGGSLITAELANQYNRDVLALPGAINQKYSSGCNYLIKNNKAHLIEDIEDLVHLLNWDIKVEKKIQKPLFHNFSENEQKLYSLIKENIEVGVDHLQIKSGFVSSLLAITLLELEMKNCIISLPGKRYKLV
jgi:DNA processing protein